MTAEQNFDWLDKQVEGLLNDFDSGESTLEETKNGFYEIIFDKLIKQIQEQQDYKQSIIGLIEDIQTTELLRGWKHTSDILEELIAKIKEVK